MEINKRQITIFASYFLISIISIFAIIFFYFYQYSNSKIDIQENKLVIIQEKSSVKSIVKLLYDEKIIKDLQSFYVISRIYSLKYYLKSGEYEITPGMSHIDILNKLKNHEVYIRKITIPEGLTVKQIKEKLYMDPYLKGEITSDYPEGYLFPSTYHYVYGDNRQKIIEKMHQEMLTHISNILPNAGDAEINQILTLASIIEKETSIENERPIVSSVYMNRLKKNMKLQADPTTIYGVTDGYGQMNRSLNYNDLKSESPYNTYFHYGLPPKPICNVSLSSIRSAMNPAKTNFLYFVADGKGGHNFAENLNQHNNNVKIYRKKSAS